MTAAEVTNIMVLNKIVCQVDALRPLKTKAASLELLEKELASRDSLIASLQRQVSASSRSSPGQHSRASGSATQHDAGAQRTSMEVITLQAEVRRQHMHHNDGRPLTHM